MMQMKGLEKPEKVGFPFNTSKVNLAPIRESKPKAAPNTKAIDEQVQLTHERAKSLNKTVLDYNIVRPYDQKKNEKDTKVANSFRMSIQSRNSNLPSQKSTDEKDSKAFVKSRLQNRNDSVCSEVVLESEVVVNSGQKNHVRQAVNLNLSERFMRA